MSMEKSTEATSTPTNPNMEGTRPILPVKPPKPFDFTKPEEWPRWIKGFDHYRIVLGLYKQNEELQVNTLYAMGGKAEDIMSGFAFPEASDAKK